MENPKSEEEKIIEDIRTNKLKKKIQNDTAIKDVRNLFRLKTEVKVIKDIVPRTFLSMKKKKKIIINK